MHQFNNYDKTITIIKDEPQQFSQVNRWRIDRNLKAKSQLKL